MKTHIKKLHIGSCFLLMCSMAERLQNDFPVLFGVFRFEVFLHDQLFEAVDVYIGRIPCGIGIASFDCFQYHPVLLRHVLRSAEIIVIDISESEDQLLKLLYHLNEDLVVARFYDNAVEACIVLYHVLHITVGDGCIVFG